MGFFDLRTAYLVTGMLYFVMPAGVWLALRHSRQRSVNEWCAGGAFFGLGLLLLSLRHHLPNVITYEVAAVLMNMGHLARVTALRRELKRPLGLTTSMALLGLFLLLYELGHWLDPLGHSFYLVSQTSLACYFCWIALLAFRLARQEKLLSAFWLGTIYIPLTLLVSIHAFRVGLGLAGMGALQPDWGTIAIVLMGCITAVIGNTSFMGIYVERTTRQQLAVAAEQARLDENTRLAHQIAHLDRVRGMGTLTGSVVHELSQPLTSIQLIAEHAQLEGEASEPNAAPMLTHIGNILRQVSHANEVLRRIRTFMAPRENPHAPVSLQEVHHKVMALMHDWFRAEEVTLETRAPRHPVKVQGDSVQLAQILVNLCRNSIQSGAGRPHRLITIDIRQEGTRALLQVRDNGPGFSQEALEQLDQGFFSSKSDGLGLGLLISRQIAEQHKGQLIIGNHPAGGAMVQLNLPLAD